MTDRQRALVSSIVYVVRNRRFFTWHRIGVRRIPDGAKMYEFHGELMPQKIDMQDERYQKIMDESYLENPWGVKIQFIGAKATDRIKIIIPENSIEFRGEDGDFFKYEGRCYLNDDKIEIRDYSQDKDKYLYQIIW